MKVYPILFSIMFATALYFAMDGYIGVFAGLILGYSVGQAFEEEKEDK